MVGEPGWRIIFVEILPNLVPLIGINIVGSIIYAIVAQTTLEYLGFGDPLNVTWGTMLYNAQNSSAIIVGAWWDIGAPARRHRDGRARAWRCSTSPSTRSPTRNCAPARR